MSKTKKKTEAVVQPIIRVDGQPHVLETMFEGSTEELPLMKSVGYMRLNDNKNSWISYVITTRGKEVVSVEVSEPNLRPIAEESAKISFVQSFVDQE